jgi:hypothetical protein
VRRAVEALTQSAADAVGTPAVREQAFALLGRDSESLGERMFDRIVRDAADAGLVALRADGDRPTVGRVEPASTNVADQLNRASAAAQAAPGAADASVLRGGLGVRGLARGRGPRGAGGPPPELLLLGAVQTAAPAAAQASTVDDTPALDFAADAPVPAVAAELGAFDGGADDVASPDAAVDVVAAVLPPLTRGGLRGRSRSRGGRLSAPPAPEMLLTGAVTTAPRVAASTTGTASVAPAAAPLTAPAAVPVPAAVPAPQPSRPRVRRHPRTVDVGRNLVADASDANDGAADAANDAEGAPPPAGGRGRGRGRGRGGARKAGAAKQAAPTPHRLRPLPPRGAGGEAGGRSPARGEAGRPQGGPARERRPAHPPRPRPAPAPAKTARRPPSAAPARPPRNARSERAARARLLTAAPAAHGARLPSPTLGGGGRRARSGPAPARRSRPRSTTATRGAWPATC